MPTTPYLPPPPTTQGTNLSPTDYQWMLIMQGIAPLYEVDTSKGSYSEAAPSAGVSSSGQTAQCKEITYVKTTKDSNAYTLTGVQGGSLTLTKYLSTFTIKSDGTNWYPVSSSESGSGPVLTFIGRTGNVVAISTDYSAFYDALGAAAAAQAAAEAASDPVGSAAAAAAAALAMAEAFSSNANNLSSGTVPNARLANIPNSALANDAVTIDGDGVCLAPAGVTAVLGATATLDTASAAPNTFVAGPASGSSPAALVQRAIVPLDLPYLTNTQSGLTYALQNSDWTKTIILANAAGTGIALTLAAAGATFPNGWWTEIVNEGKSAAILTITTSTVLGVNKIVIPPGASFTLTSDGTNYHLSGVDMTGSLAGTGGFCIGPGEGYQAGTNAGAASISGGSVGVFVAVMTTLRAAQLCGHCTCTVSATVASSIFDVALYDNAGNLLIDVAGAAGFNGASATTQSKSFTQMLLLPGVYFGCWCLGTNATGALTINGSFVNTAVINANIAANGTRFATAANHWSAVSGAPATLGALNKIGNTAIPVFFFEP